MTLAQWLESLWSGDTLYLSVSCLVSLLLVGCEVLLLALRQRSILEHLGWTAPDVDTDFPDSRLTSRDEA